MHARFDHGFAVTLRAQAGFDRNKDFIIAERKPGDIVTAKVTNGDRILDHDLMPGLYK